MDVFDELFESELAIVVPHIRSVCSVKFGYNVPLVNVILPRDICHGHYDTQSLCRASIRRSAFVLEA